MQKHSTLIPGDVPVRWNEGESAKIILSRAYHQGQAKAILASGLPDDEKMRLLEEAKKPLTEEITKLEKQLTPTTHHLDVLTELLEWGKRGKDKPNEYQKAASSRLHHLIVARKENRIVYPGQDDRQNLGRFDTAKVKLVTAIWAAQMEQAQAFVVQHDWAAAFEKSSDDIYGEIILPANPAAFEFQVDGKRCIVLVGDEGTNGPDYATFIEAAAGWCMTIPKSFSLGGNPYTDYNPMISDGAFKQIRAICVALEAEVAETESIRAPHKVNMAREKRGNPPINDYHIVNLKNRSRVRSLDESTGTHRSPRLHFRRGHWRHYEQHKTWIKWMLVGDPDLGFIDKEYRL